MGTGDRTDSTTDFFDTHREQCMRYASKLRGVVGAEALVDALDQAVLGCDAAIARGRHRIDMPSVTADLTTISTRHAALPPRTKTDFRDALREDDRVAPTPRAGPLPDGKQPSRGDTPLPTR